MIDCSPYACRWHVVRQLPHYWKNNIHWIRLSSHDVPVAELLPFHFALDLSIYCPPIQLYCPLPIWITQTSTEIKKKKKFILEYLWFRLAWTKCVFLPDECKLHHILTINLPIYHRSLHDRLLSVHRNVQVYVLVEFRLTLPAAVSMIGNG